MISTKFLLSTLLKQSATKISRKCLNSNTTLNKWNIAIPYLCLKIKHSFSTQTIQGKSPFVFRFQSQPQYLKLQLQYRGCQNINIFSTTIKQSTGILDQMTIFKIFKIMQTATYNNQAYQNFFILINQSFKKKSDNILMLLATIKQRIARYYINQKTYQHAIKCLEDALDILQNSLVPPLFPYYSVYREYGMIHYQLGQTQKAKEILTQSVNILHDFVSHSDDQVTSNDYCKKQASAYNALAKLDKQNSKQWVDRANKSWQGFTDNRFDDIQYARTIAQTLKQEIKQDKQKGQSFYHFNLYKFQKKQLKEIIKKAKQETN